MEALEKYFKEADIDNDGKISRLEGVVFFSGFALSREVVSQIWMYADHDKSGFLSRLEFFNALRLVTVAQSGRAFTPEIVNSVLYGPMAAYIPAPQMTSVGPTPTPQVTLSPAMPQGIRITSGTVNENQLELVDPDRSFNLTRILKGIPTSSIGTGLNLARLGVNLGRRVAGPTLQYLRGYLLVLQSRLESPGSMPSREQGYIEDICTELQATLIQKVEETKNALLKELNLTLDLLQEENKKLQEERDNAVKEVEKLRAGAGAGPGSYEAFSKFSLLELKQATENFNDSHKIGKGGFGCVYKGFLRNTMVAIKMLHPESLQGKPEFEQEVAILSTMRHPNLVTLIGTCSEHSALVYEYLPNGSLEDRLACKGGTPPLTWQVRTRIIGEICRALLFLRSNKPNPIVHGDLNPSNILLDANLVSKLSDFGISRLLIESNTNTLVYHTKNPKGTFAYMDPEFQRSGQITVKSDVYSFGIIILQLLTGKPPINIIADVEDAVKDNSLHLIMDKSAGEWPFVQAKQLANLGLRCTQMRRTERPNLESEWKLVESLMMAASLSVSPSFKSQLDDKGIPSYFMCPIFQEVMKDPHLAADGYTYEAEAIKGWLDGRHKTSPMTNSPLIHIELTPNHALRSAIQEWLQHHPYGSNLKILYIYSALI